MGASLVVPGTAPEADWHAARASGVTASEIAAVLGLSSFESPFSLYHRKRGDLGPQPDNDAMSLGRYLEAFVVSRFIEQRPDLDVTGDGRTLYASPDRRWQLATPDRLVCEAGGGLTAVLECKTTASYDGWGYGGDEIPVAYRCQVLWQMDVMAVTTGYVACLFLHTRKLRIYQLTLGGQELEDLEVMRLEAGEFLRRVASGDPPPVDWAPPTTAALKRLHNTTDGPDVIVPWKLGRDYQAACAAVKRAGQRKKLAENRIRERLGDGCTVWCGTEIIASRRIYQRGAYTVKAATIDALYPARKPETP